MEQRPSACALKLGINAKDKKVLTTVMHMNIQIGDKTIPEKHSNAAPEPVLDHSSKRYCLSWYINNGVRELL